MSADATELHPIDWGVRTAVYEHFAETRHGPTNHELASKTGGDLDEIETSLRRLEDGHHLALFPDRREVWMAHPFSAVPTAYPVDTDRGRYWAPCAFDALGLPELLGIDGSTHTSCAESGEAVSFGVRDGEIQADTDLRVHLLVPLRDAWNDIGFT